MPKWEIDNVRQMPPTKVFPTISDISLTNADTNESNADTNGINTDITALNADTKATHADTNVTNADTFQPTRNSYRLKPSSKPMLTDRFRHLCQHLFKSGVGRYLIYTALSPSVSSICVDNSFAFFSPSFLPVPLRIR